MSDSARAGLPDPPAPAQTPAEYRLEGLWDCIEGEPTGAMVMAFRERRAPYEPEPDPEVWTFLPVEISGDPPREVALQPKRHIFEPVGGGGIDYRTIGPGDVPEAINVQLAHVEGVEIVEADR